RFLTPRAAGLREPAVRDEGQRSTGRKHVSGLLPADLGVDPVERGRREHCLKLPAGEQSVLKPGGYKFPPASACQVLPGQRDEVLARVERGDMQAAGGQAACQLTAPAPDLKHMITGTDPCALASLVDEFTGMGRAVP